MPRNVWHVTIKLGDFFRSDDLTVEEKAKEIVKRIRDSRWRDISGSQLLLDDLLEELGSVADAAEFDYVWNEIYDLADIDRVWIETW